MSFVHAKNTVKSQSTQKEKPSYLWHIARMRAKHVNEIKTSFIEQKQCSINNNAIFMVWDLTALFSM